MSLKERQVDTVYQVFKTLCEQRGTAITPGDVVAAMRESNNPIGVWAIRGMFSQLEHAGLIRADPETGRWMLNPEGGKRQAG